MSRYSSCSFTAIDNSPDRRRWIRPDGRYERDEAAADRRHTLADPDWDAVAMARIGMGRGGRRSVEKGDLQKEPPGGLAAEPDDHGLGRSRGGLTTKLLPGRRARPEADVGHHHGRTARGLPHFRPVAEAIRAPRTGQAPSPAPIASGQTRRTPPERTVPTCGNVGSAAPSRTRPTTRNVTLSNAESSATARSPPATRNSPSATK